MIERRNINRGYKKLRAWQDAVDLYVLAVRIFSAMPNNAMRVSSHSIDAAHSISRNIAEGYCRKSLKEYLNYLNYSLGSCGEFHSSCYSCFKANQISNENFEQLDQLHYKVENQLIQLIKSLQLKQRDGEWVDDLITESTQPSNTP